MSVACTLVASASVKFLTITAPLTYQLTVWVGVAVIVYPSGAEAPGARESESGEAPFCSDQFQV